MARALSDGYRLLERQLDKLRSISDALDDASGRIAVDLILNAHSILEESVVMHEREDETTSTLIKAPHRYARVVGDEPTTPRYHQARLLARFTHGRRTEDADKYLVRDAQR